MATELRPEYKRGTNETYRTKHASEISAQRRSIKGKHQALMSHYLRKERTPRTDLLWNFHFYEAFIQDAACHYCWGPCTGLDAMDNKQGHQGWNVVPCCKTCNVMKSGHLSYSQMMRFAPLLREFKNEYESTRDSNAKPWHYLFRRQQC